MVFLLRDVARGMPKTAHVRSKALLFFYKSVVTARVRENCVAESLGRQIRELLEKSARAPVFLLLWRRVARLLKALDQQQPVSIGQAVALSLIDALRVGHGFSMFVAE